MVSDGGVMLPPLICVLFSVICYPTINNVLNSHSTDMISLPCRCQMTPWRFSRCLQTVVIITIQEKTYIHIQTVQIFMWFFVHIFIMDTCIYWISHCQGCYVNSKHDSCLFNTGHSIRTNVTLLIVFLGNIYL